MLESLSIETLTALLPLFGVLILTGTIAGVLAGLLGVGVGFEKHH